MSGRVTLTATATGPAPISQVQFLLDGRPLGSPVTAAPYSMTWNVGSVPPGSHYLSVQATDSRGFVGTAAGVPINVASPPIQIGSIAVDSRASATGNGDATTPAFSSSSGETLLAFVGSDGPVTGQTATVTGGYADGGDAEVWTATASNYVGRTVGPGQSLLAQSLDASTGDSYWTQFASSASTSVGQSIKLNDTAPTADMFNLVVVEVTAGSPPPPPLPDTQPPLVSIINPQPGQTVSGTTQVSANASDNVAIKSVQFFLNGNPLGAPVTSPPYAVSWNTTTATNGSNTLTATAVDPSGNVGRSSSDIVTVQNPLNPPPCFVMDAHVSVDGSGAVTTPAFHTAQAGETLLAFAADDGPAGAGRQSVMIAGGGLTWTKVQRANSQAGDAEIWKASASQPLSNVTITSTPTTLGYHQSLTVIAMQMTQGVGASVTGTGRAGQRGAVGLAEHDTARLARLRGGSRLGQRDRAHRRYEPGPGPPVGRHLGRQQLLDTEHDNPIWRRRKHGNAQRHSANRGQMEHRGSRASR